MGRNKLLVACLTLALSLCALAARDHTLQVESLYSEWRRAQKAYTTQVRAAQTPEDREALKVNSPDPAFAKRFLALAQKLGPEDHGTAEALVYAIYADMSGPVGEKAMELLAHDHVNSTSLELLLGSTLPTGAAAENLFRAIAEKSTKRALQAQATMILADMFKDYRPEEAEALYRQIVEQFADIRRPDGSLRERAQKGLIFLQRLSIGKVAPDSSGQDLEGKPFKLSDYRGKVVLICFCGEWCPPCRALYPYERSLVERMKEKPFALIGVSTDPKDKALAAVKREKLTWRFWWDGGSPEGPIATEWQIQGWPNLYLIDHKGVIREHWVGSPDHALLDRKIEQLLVEQEARK